MSAQDTPAREAWELLQQLMMNVLRPRVVQLCAEYDITPPQLLTLRHLETDTPMSMSDAAKLLKCDASNVTGIVDRLETRGLVERRSAPGDRRVKMLALTDDGARFRQELLRRMADPPPVIADLPEKDQRALRDVLRRAIG
jgi:DNA-binding MarR family transcriptional regulator